MNSVEMCVLLLPKEVSEACFETGKRSEIQDFSSTWLQQEERAESENIKTRLHILIYTSLLDCSIPNSLFFSNKLILFPFTTKSCPGNGPNTNTFDKLSLIIILW